MERRDGLCRRSGGALFGRGHLNPGGGGNYSDTVSIEKTGQTYRVIWIVGSTRYVGTGIGDKNFLAVSYKSGTDTGLALYGTDGGNWAGVDLCRRPPDWDRNLEARVTLPGADGPPADFRL